MFKDWHEPDYKKLVKTEMDRAKNMKAFGIPSAEI